MDTTHAAIRDTFRELGWQVIDTSGLGNFVDLVVLSPRGKVILVEAKTPKSKAGRVKFTVSQEKLMNAGWPIVVMWRVEQVIALTQRPA